MQRHRINVAKTAQKRHLQRRHAAAAGGGGASASAEICGGIINENIVDVAAAAAYRHRLCGIKYQ